MAIRDNKKGKEEHKLHNIDITAKEFGADDNNGKDAAMWKNREKDWYNAERRFIFATHKKVERKNWIDKVIKDKIAVSLKKGMAAVILQGRMQRAESPNSQDAHDPNTQSSNSNKNSSKFKAQQMLGLKASSSGKLSGITPIDASTLISMFTPSSALTTTKQSTLKKSNSKNSVS